MRAVSLDVIEPARWERDFAANAHLAVFRETIEEPDGIDIAILGLIDGRVAAYSTAKDIGSGMLHLYYGGAIEEFRGSREIQVLYRMVILKYLKISNYLRTYVHNENVSYLTMALRAGFRVTGIKQFKGDTLLELTLDREHK